MSLNWIILFFGFSKNWSPLNCWFHHSFLFTLLVFKHLLISVSPSSASVITSLALLKSCKHKFSARVYVITQRLLFSSAFHRDSELWKQTDAQISGSAFKTRASVHTANCRRCADVAGFKAHRLWEKTTYLHFLMVISCCVFYYAT